VKYRVVIEPDEDGVFVAECPVLPGCISQGKTRDEALANIKDAMTGYLASLKKHGELVRDHRGFLNSYSPKDEGLYVDAAVD
jgi:predicted RNase H-like HicB family nuclease